MRLISLPVVLALAATAACAQTSGARDSTSTAQAAQAAAQSAPKTRRVCVTEDSINSRVARRVCHTETVDDAGSAQAAPPAAGGAATPAG